MITVEYDDKKVSEKEIEELSIAVQKIVSEATEIKDVFVYANTAKIKIQVAPIEVFVWMSAPKIEDADVLTTKIKTGLTDWKNVSGFSQPINLSLIPMNWKVEIGI